MKEFYGSTIWARQTLESDIFFWKPAEWFKIWFYIVSKVNHKDTKFFPRGTGLFNFSVDRQELRWCTEDQWKKCIKFLKTSTMISTRRSTRGNVITVLNYAKFQDAIKKKAPTKAPTGALSKHEGSTPINNNGKHDKHNTVVSPPKETMEEVIEIGDDGEPRLQSPKRQTYGKFPAFIAKYYCELVDKRSASQQLPAAKELMRIACEDFPEDTDEERFKEIKSRMDISKWHYEHNKVSDWNLAKVAENWDKILSDWSIERKKYL